MAVLVNNKLGGSKTEKPFRWKKSSYTPPIYVTNPSFTVNGGGYKYSIYQITDANFDMTLLPSMGGVKANSDTQPTGTLAINNTNALILRNFLNGFLADSNTTLSGDTYIQLAASYKGHNTYNFNVESPTSGWFSAWYSTSCATITNKVFTYNGTKMLVPESYTFVEYVESDYYDTYPSRGFADDGYYYEDVSFANANARLVFNDGEYDKGFYGFSFDAVSGQSSQLDATYFANKNVSGNRSVIKIGDNKALLIYASYYVMYAVVMTFSSNGATVTYGTPTEIGQGYMNSIVQIDDTRCFLAYSGWSPYGLYGMFLEVNNDTVSIGTSVLINSSIANYDYSNLQIEVHNDKIGILGRYYRSGYYYIMGGMISFDSSSNINILSTYNGNSIGGNLPYMFHYHDTTFVTYLYDSSNNMHYTITYDWDNNTFVKSTDLKTSLYSYPLVGAYSTAFDEKLLLFGGAPTVATMCSLLISTDGITTTLTMRTHVGMNVQTTSNANGRAAFCKVTDNCLVHTTDGNNIRLVKVDENYNISFTELGSLSGDRDTMYFHSGPEMFKADNTTVLLYGKKSYKLGYQYTNHIVRVGISGDMKKYEPTSMYSYSGGIGTFFRLNDNYCVILDLQSSSYYSYLIRILCPTSLPSTDGKPSSVFYTKDKGDRNIFYLY